MLLLETEKLRRLFVATSFPTFLFFAFCTQASEFFRLLSLSDFFSVSFATAFTCYDLIKEPQDAVRPGRQVTRDPEHARDGALVSDRRSGGI